MHLLTKLCALFLVIIFSNSCSTASIDETENQAEKKEKDKPYFVINELIDGYPKTKILNNNLKFYANKAEYPWNLRIIIELDEPRNDGTPSRQEDAYLNEFQEFVEEKLSRIGDFKYVGQLTWEGERRIEYYITDPTIIERFLTAMIDAKKINNTITFDIEKDKRWENYSHFQKL